MIFNALNGSKENILFVEEGQNDSVVDNGIKDYKDIYYSGIIDENFVMSTYEIQ